MTTIIRFFTGFAAAVVDPFRLPQPQLFSFRQHEPQKLEAKRGTAAPRLSAPFRLPRSQLFRFRQHEPRRLILGTGGAAARRIAAHFQLPASQLFQLRQHEPKPPTLRERSKGTASAGNGLPTIAIVTPSFNQAHFIRATIESVVGQGYPRLRYLVRDGASRDGTQDLLRSYGDRLEWRSEPDGGQAAAINLGFSEIDGDIMGYLNSDDVLTPGSLFRVAEAFRRFPEIDVLYSHRIIIDAAGLEIGRWCLPTHDAKTIFWADYIPQETMFWRRRVWDELGGLDAEFRYAMDWDFILRAHEAGFRFARLDDFLGCFRVHEEQKTTAHVHVGDAEVGRLRSRHLGFVPDYSEIDTAIQDYLAAHRRWLRRRRFGL